ncbi:hypothetical protein ACWDX9_50640, partial [Nonomuraea sp. NPDC003201]
GEPQDRDRGDVVHGAEPVAQIFVRQVGQRPASPLPDIAEARRAAGAPLLRVAAGPVLAAPARPSPAQAAQDAPAPSVVEISIGRLEVRAPQAQAAPQAKPPRKDHASVLQAYLRGRSKGELA